MTQPTAEHNATLFAGRWIGETQDCDMPAHVWEIAPRGRSLQIEMRWENERSVVRHWVQAEPGAARFRINEFVATLVDAQHFIIPAWDTNDMRGGDGPSYDVVFSRPGVAELTAHTVWLRHRDELVEAATSENTE